MRCMVCAAADWEDSDADSGVNSCEGLARIA